MSLIPTVNLLMRPDLPNENSTIFWLKTIEYFLITKNPTSE